MSSISADLARERLYGLPKQQIEQDQDKKIRSDIEIAIPQEEDLAVLSTAVSVRSESVPYTADSKRLNTAAFGESFRNYFKQSKSHNLLLERFMAHVKFNAIKMLCSLLGMSAAEQDKIQSEVRQEALAEIDAKLKQDWAYSKALLEIVG